MRWPSWCRAACCARRVRPLAPPPKWPRLNKSTATSEMVRRRQTMQQVSECRPERFRRRVPQCAARPHSSHPPPATRSPQQSARTLAYFSSAMASVGGFLHAARTATAAARAASATASSPNAPPPTTYRSSSPYDSMARGGADTIGRSISVSVSELRRRASEHVRALREPDPRGAMPSPHLL